jgi:hypothetical protein
MALVLALFFVSLVLTVVTAILLSSALGTADSSAPVRETPHLNVPPRFFASDIPLSMPAGSASAVPIELLVLEIERHVRLEREVAESFHLSPTPQTLHVHAAPPLMH